MNLLKFICYVIPVGSTIFSCDKVEGTAVPPEFDDKVISFTSDQKDTVLVSKNDVSWFFQNLIINHEYVSFEDIKYYTKDVPANADSDLAYIYKFENDWFLIEKLDNQHINVSIKENKGNESRQLGFSASVGNASTAISILQK